tara:strand:+ start:428 stop:862 length:435 start_codon:yes stop_codon:yes gene_type:complete
MKKDKRININDKNGTTFYFLFLCCLILYFYVIFFIFLDELSFKTNFCESCSGPLMLINNPVPAIMWAILTVLTAVIFPKIFRSDYVDYYERGKIIREIKYKNGDIYYGQVKDTDDGFTMANGKGLLTKKNGNEIKGVWKKGELQ